MKPLIAIVMILICAKPLHAQKKQAYKFEKITPALLQTRQYAVDSGASAVVLADVGTAVLEGNTKGGFKYILKRHRRVHVLSSGGYPAATMEITLFHDGAGSDDRLADLKASTYNLEGTGITETRLEKGSIFRDKKTKNVEYVRFTLPAVRPGSIIDIEYKVESDYIYNLPPWYFQGNYPTLWSDFTLNVPYFLFYTYMKKGHNPFFIEEQDQTRELYTVVNNSAVTGGTEQVIATSLIKHWVMKDVPAFTSAPYLFYPPDHQSHLDFQLSGVKEENGETTIPNWSDKGIELARSVSFGFSLDRNNYYFDNYMASLRSTDKLQEAKNAYYFIRNLMKCNGQTGIYLDNGLRDPFTNRIGSVAEINMLLTALLRKLGFKASPVIISTRDNGALYGLLPMLRKMNYVIVHLEVNGKTYQLDATVPGLGFGQLRPYCYNGLGLRVNESPALVSLGAQDLVEKKITSVFVNNFEKGTLSGVFQQLPGMLQSFDMRRTIAEKGKEEVVRDWTKKKENAFRLRKVQIDSVDREEQPLSIRSELSLDLGTDSLVYVDPLFGEGISEIPFNAAKRSLPVELNSAINETYMLNFYVPEGYAVEQLPKPIRFYLNEKGEGSFEYEISENDGIIRLQMTLRLGRTLYREADYEELRAFFQMIGSKQKDKIVLRRIASATR